MSVYTFPPPKGGHRNGNGDHRDGQVLRGGGGCSPSRGLAAADSGDGARRGPSGCPRRRPGDRQADPGEGGLGAAAKSGGFPAAAGAPGASSWRRSASGCSASSGLGPLWPAARRRGECHPEDAGGCFSAGAALKAAVPTPHPARWSPKNRAHVHAHTCMCMCMCMCLSMYDSTVIMHIKYQGVHYKHSELLSIHSAR